MINHLTFKYITTIRMHMHYVQVLYMPYIHVLFQAHSTYFINYEGHNKYRHLVTNHTSFRKKVKILHIYMYYTTRLGPGLQCL